METTISDKILNGLHKAVAEIEELQVQTALGKAEAKDLYEDTKKKFGEFMNRTRSGLNAGSEKVKGGSEKVRSLLSSIEKAVNEESLLNKETFDEQKQKLTSLFRELESLIDDTLSDHGVAQEIKHETERFKLKMELLKLQFDIKQLDTKEEIEKKRKRYAEKLEDLRKKFDSIVSDGNKTWTSLKTEVSQAYEHLKNEIIQ